MEINIFDFNNLIIFSCMDSIEHFSAVTIEGKKYNFMIFSLIGGLGIIVVFLALEFKAAPLIIFGTILTVLLPTVLEKKIRKKYSKIVEIEITDHFFSIKFFDMDNIYLDVENVIQFNDLESFRTVRAMYDNTILLELYLRSGGKVEYTFLNQGSKSKSNIIDPFFAHIRSFNKAQDEIQIGIRHTFISSKAGLWSLGLIFVLLIVCLVTHLIMNPIAISLSILPGIGLYLGLISMRTKELALVKKLNQDNGD